MKIEMWPTSNVKPYAKNPRDNDNAVAPVAASIKEYGFRQPIVVDADGVIIVGHTRHRAAQILDLAEVPVHIATDLSPAKVKAYRLADNKTGELATWDEDVLADEIVDLRSLADMPEIDLDMTALGFGDDELDALFADDLNEGETDPDDVPERPEDPITQRGDLWILGDHRIVCGDATSADDVASLLEEAKPGLMVTDPPYGVNYDATWRGKSGLQEEDTGRVGGFENDDRADWAAAWQLFPGDVAYIWHASLHVIETAQGLKAANFILRTQIVWAKPRIAISRGAYHWQHEPCFYAVRKGKTADWIGGRKQSTLWQIDLDKNVEGGHSAQKPVECMRRPMRNHEANEVYEPFAGSGTTIIAAEQLGRRCFAMEIDPCYVDVAVRRWELFAGKEGERIPASR